MAAAAAAAAAASRLAEAVAPTEHVDFGMVQEELIYDGQAPQLIYPFPGDWRSPIPVKESGGGGGGFVVSSGQFFCSYSFLTLRCPV